MNEETSAVTGLKPDETCREEGGQQPLQEPTKVSEHPGKAYLHREPGWSWPRWELWGSEG